MDKNIKLFLFLLIAVLAILFIFSQQTHITDDDKEMMDEMMQEEMMEDSMNEDSMMQKNNNSMMMEKESKTEDSMMEEYPFVSPSTPEHRAAFKQKIENTDFYTVMEAKASDILAFCPSETDLIETFDTSYISSRTLTQGSGESAYAHTIYLTPRHAFNDTQYCGELGSEFLYRILPNYYLWGTTFTGGILQTPQSEADFQKYINQEKLIRDLKEYQDGAPLSAKEYENINNQLQRQKDAMSQ